MIGGPSEEGDRVIRELMAPAYRVGDGDFPDEGMVVLFGPDGFSVYANPCEAPEDLIWTRALAPVVTRLNEQYDLIIELKRQLAECYHWCPQCGAHPLVCDGCKKEVDNEEGGEPALI